VLCRGEVSRLGYRNPLSLLHSPLSIAISPPRYRTSLFPLPSFFFLFAFYNSSTSIHRLSREMRRTITNSSVKRSQSIGYYCSHCIIIICTSVLSFICLQRLFSMSDICFLFLSTSPFFPQTVDFDSIINSFYHLLFHPIPPLCGSISDSSIIPLFFLCVSASESGGI